MWEGERLSLSFAASAALRETEFRLEYLAQPFRFGVERRRRSFASQNPTHVVERGA